MNLSIFRQQILVLRKTKALTEKKGEVVKLLFVR